jgi:hypothetical protein
MTDPGWAREQRRGRDSDYDASRAQRLAEAEAWSRFAAAWGIALVLVAAPLAFPSAPFDAADAVARLVLGWFA